MALNNTISPDRETVTVGQDGVSQFNGNTQDAIQNAVDYLASNNGGTIYIKKGTYNISSSIDASGSSYPINFIGDGETTILNNTNEDGTIDTLKLSDNSFVKNIYFIGVNTSDEVKSGNNLNVSDNCKITQCYFFGGNRGIYAFANTKVIVSDCSFSSSKEHGIAFSGGSGSSCTYCRVSNCIFDGNSDTTKRGIYFLQSKWCSVSNCYFKDHSARGIFVNRGSEYITITGNEFENNFHHITVENDTIESGEGASRYVTITGNIFKDSTSSAVNLSGTTSNEAEYCTVTGNYFDSNNSAGISLNGISNIASNNTIYNGNQYGILIGGDKNVANSNIINTMSSYGIYITGNNANVSNNKIDATTTYGIYSTGDNISITANNIYNCGTGIRSNGSVNVISSNIVSNCSTRGIMLGSGSTDSNVSNNIIDTCGDRAVYSDSGRRNVINGNNFINNTATNIHIIDPRNQVITNNIVSGGTNVIFQAGTTSGASTVVVGNDFSGYSGTCYTFIGGNEIGHNRGE